MARVTSPLLALPYQRVAVDLPRRQRLPTRLPSRGAQTVYLQDVDEAPRRRKQPITRPRVFQARVPRAISARQNLQTRLPSQNVLSNIMKRAMVEEKENPNLTEYDASVVAMVCDPCGQARSGLPYMVRWPDADAEHTAVIYTSGHTTFSGATATSAWIQNVGFRQTGGTVDQELQITHGADAGDVSATMTTVVEVFSDQAQTPSTVLGNGSRFRWLSGGMIVNLSSAKEISSGFVEPCEARINLRTAAAVYSSNASINPRFVGPKRNLADGCTVRRSVNQDQLMFAFSAPNTYSATDNPHDYGYGKMPMLRLTQMNADTVVDIIWTNIYEIVPGAACFLPLDTSPSSTEISEIIRLCSVIPQSASGHSFRDFLETVWRGARKVGRVMWENKEVVAKLVKEMIK